MTEQEPFNKSPEPYETLYFTNMATLLFIITLQEQSEVFFIKSFKTHFLSYFILVSMEIKWLEDSEQKCKCTF